MKKYLIPLFVCIFALIAGLSIFAYISHIREEERLLEKQSLINTMSYSMNDDSVDIEYGANIYADDIVDSDYTVEHVKFDTTVLGKSRLETSLSGVTVFDDTVSKQIFIEYNVADTNYPVIELSAPYVSLKVGAKFDAKSNIKSCYDKVDGDLTYEVKHNVNTKKEGVYLVNISAVDNNGNTTYASYEVFVGVKPTVTEGTSSYGGQVELDDNGFYVEDGDYGAIKVGSYQAALHGSGKLYDGSLDKYIEAPTAAAVYRLPSKVLYIVDHSSQGFNNTKENDILFIRKTDGNVDKYIRDKIYYVPKGGWVADDNTDFWGDKLETDLVTQACEDGSTFVFVTWKKK